MSETLHVQTTHRAACAFGPGFYRLHLRDNGVRYCLSTGEVERAARLLGELLVRVERDGYCLDSPYEGDANTPDVVDGEQWLGMPRDDAMHALGITLEADYVRAYRAIEEAVLRRDNRAAQGGVRASIVIKKKGARVVDA